MKSFITIFLFLLFFTPSIAQNTIYVHTVSESSLDATTPNGSILDHPDLNGNPDAKFVFSRLWATNPNITGVYNDNIMGLWYRGSNQRWYVYNEDYNEPIVMGSSYNILIGNASNVITHTSNGNNTVNHITWIDDSRLNGENPGPYAVMSKVFNNVYNTNNTAFYYEETYNKRAIFCESVNNIMPEGASFNIFIAGEDDISIDVLSSETNSNSNVVYIDNDFLNDNPDAKFVFSHYWGSSGPDSEVYLDKVFGSFYEVSTNMWGIYTEDGSNMPLNVSFDIIIADVVDIVSIDKINNEIDLSLESNPVQDWLQLDTKIAMDNIVIFDASGKSVANKNIKSDNCTMDVSFLEPGVYFGRVTFDSGFKTIKIIKE